MQFIPKEKSKKQAKIIKINPDNEINWQVSESPYGILLSEALSAFIKSMRCGEWREACWFAHQIFISGPEAEAYLWMHLHSHCVEDIGLAAPEAITNISNLHKAYYLCAEETERRWLVGFGAIRYMCSLPKDRANDEGYAKMIIDLREGNIEHPKIPDRALDHHTKAGKKLGRGLSYFFNEATELKNEKRDGSTNTDLLFLKERAKKFDNIF